MTIAASSLLLAFLIGLSLGAVVAWSIGRSRSSVDAGRADELRQRVQALDADAVNLRERAAAADRARVEAETRNIAAERRVEDERRFVDEARERLTDAFKALAADALSGSQRDFLQLADEKFKTLRADASDDLETRRLAIQALVGPLQQALDGYQKEARGIEERRQRDLGQVGEQLRDVAVTHQALRAETNKLVQALRAPNVRGRWGEIALRRVAELPACRRSATSPSRTTVAGREQQAPPDVIVRLPSDARRRHRPKVPLAAYLDAIDAATSTPAIRHCPASRPGAGPNVQPWRRGYAAEIEHVGRIRGLFIPNDSFLAAAPSARPTCRLGLGCGSSWRRHDVVRAAARRRVRLAAGTVSPRDAQKIAAVGASCPNAWPTSSSICHTWACARQTVKAYNQAVASLESRVLPRRASSNRSASAPQADRAMRPIDQGRPAARSAAAHAPAVSPNPACPQASWGSRWPRHRAGAASPMTVFLNRKACVLWIFMAVWMFS